MSIQYLLVSSIASLTLLLGSSIAQDFQVAAIKHDMQPVEVIELWPSQAPDEPKELGEEVLRKSPVLDRKQVEVTESTQLVTNVSKPAMHLYQTTKEKRTGTAMIVCPGGGYWDLYWELEGKEVATWLNDQGIAAIVLKYRVPRRPDDVKGEPARRPLQDAQRALRIARSKASEWGIEPTQIGMIGFSAGGHLAIATATEFDRQTYAPIDALDTTSCRPDFAVGVYSGYLKHKEKDEISPSLKVPANTPPVFLAHGGDDLISSPEQSLFMYLALKRAGVPAELHIYASTAHDFGVRSSNRPYSDWKDSCIHWLRDQKLLIQKD